MASVTITVNISISISLSPSSLEVTHVFTVFTSVVTPSPFVFSARQKLPPTPGSLIPSFQVNPGQGTVSVSLGKEAPGPSPEKKREETSPNISSLDS